MTDVERRAPRRMTLVLLSGLSVMSLNLFLPSLPKMAVDFETDYGQVTLSIALYAVATAIVQIVAGPLSDRFGRRPVILWALVIFTLASIGCFLKLDRKFSCLPYGAGRDHYRIQRFACDRAGRCR